MCMGGVRRLGDPNGMQWGSSAGVGNVWGICRCRAPRLTLPLMPAEPLPPLQVEPLQRQLHLAEELCGGLEALQGELDACKAACRSAEDTAERRGVEVKRLQQQAHGADTLRKYQDIVGVRAGGPGEGDWSYLDLELWIGQSVVTLGVRDVAWCSRSLV